MEHTSGICRIVPPPGWSAGLASDFAIDRAGLKFNARVQRVDQLQRKHTAVASQRFWEEYQVRVRGGGLLAVDPRPCAGCRLLPAAAGGCRVPLPRPTPVQRWEARRLAQQPAAAPAWRRCLPAFPAAIQLRAHTRALGPRSAAAIRSLELRHGWRQRV